MLCFKRAFSWIHQSSLSDQGGNRNSNDSKHNCDSSVFYLLRLRLKHTKQFYTNEVSPQKTFNLFLLSLFSSGHPLHPFVRFYPTTCIEHSISTLRPNMTFHHLLIIALYFLNLVLCIAVYEPTASDIERLRVSVLNKIDTFGNEDDGPEFKPLIGSILRLVFHDCSGPYNPGTTAATNVNTKRLCDGCIDLDKLDHGGLQSLAVEPLEEICAEYVEIMNRADCWAAIGNIAIEYSHSLAINSDPLPNLPYFFGREQCQLSPNAITGDDPGTEFPLAHLGWDPLMEFFHTFFGFTVEEVTAIMGAHTVGRAHKSASGFEGKWTKDSFAFNNDFYVVMLDKTNQWDQTEPKHSGFPQWTNKGRAEGEEELVMLNSDMSLVIMCIDIRL